MGTATADRSRYRARHVPGSRALPPTAARGDAPETRNGVGDAGGQAYESLQAAARRRGHGKRTSLAGVGGLFGGLLGSFLGPLGAAFGAFGGALLGSLLGARQDRGRSLAPGSAMQQPRTGTRAPARTGAAHNGARGRPAEGSPTRW